MNTKQGFKLVEGEFTPQDAREVLTNLYTSKLNFHLMKNFSSTERYGKSDETASKRIPELKKSLAMINTLIQEATHKKEKLIISATVHIEFEAIEE